MSEPTLEKVEAKTTPGPFLLGESLFPISAKLVAKIQSGEFVDMAELMRDNVELDRRQADSQQKHSRREVPDLLSWVTSFGMFASVLADKSPKKTRQLWAYQTVIVREARRCGGKGWQMYDAMFRQQAAQRTEADWSNLNSAIYATTFLAQANGRGCSCTHFLETDDALASCALAPLNLKPRKGEEK